MREYAMIERELGMHCEVRRLRTHEKSNTEEADSIVARHLPKNPRASLRHFLSISTANLAALSSVWAIFWFCSITPTPSVSHTAPRLYKAPLTGVMNVLHLNLYFSTPGPTLISLLPTYASRPPLIFSRSGTCCSYTPSLEAYLITGHLATLTLARNHLTRSLPVHSSTAITSLSCHATHLHSSRTFLTFFLSC